MFYHVMYDTYSHHIWSGSEPQAKAIAKKLNFKFDGRSVYSPKEYRTSILANQEGGLGREDVLHSLCFLTYLAHRQGIVSPEEVCGDKSPLHALIHHRQFGSRNNEFKHQIAYGIIFLEQNVLGVPPKSVKLNVYKYDKRFESVPDDLSQPFDVYGW